MGDFTAEWLALREPHDRRSRNGDVLAAVAAHFAAAPALSIVDLGCGTGATLRALAPHLAARQSWHLVDNDLSLLARAPQSQGAASLVRATPVDLVHDLEAALDGLVDLVTTSAFLDLVSAEWLERLVTEVAARGLPFYAALSYDGRMVHAPPDPADDSIVAAFNRHQRNDKGFGPALGPDAATTAIKRFEHLGYTVLHGRADWLLHAGDQIYQSVHAGVAGAVQESGDCPPNKVEAWVKRSTCGADASAATLHIGHVDFFACPTSRR